MMLLRATKTEERGDSQYLDDFSDLMSLALAKGIRFGGLSQEEMGKILLAERRAGDHSDVDPGQVC